MPISALPVLTKVTFSPPPEVACVDGEILPPDFSFKTTEMAAAAFPYTPVAGLLQIQEIPFLPL